VSETAVKNSQKYRDARCAGFTLNIADNGAQLSVFGSQHLINALQGIITAEDAKDAEVCE